MTPEQETLAHIRRTITAMPDEQRQLVLDMASKLRAIFEQQPLLLVAFSLVAAELQVFYPQEG